MSVSVELDEKTYAFGECFGGDGRTFGESQIGVGIACGVRID
jgi:hypothetical protein